METAMQRKRTILFLVLAFGIAWAFESIIYLTGGLAGMSVGSRPWLLLSVSMFAPALASLLTRWITHEGFGETYLRPRLKHSWRYWLIAWFVTPLMILLGVGLFFLVFPYSLDPTLAVVQQQLARVAQLTGRSIPLSPAALILVETVEAILIAPLVNGIATFGEEFGWRAYLLPKLMPMGGRRAMLWIGLIWGIWHWPAILMGYNYGLDYPGAPWLGPLMMVWFTFIVGIFLGWLTLKSKSVWPAVIAHAAINGIAAVGLLLFRGQPDLLLGPTGTGLVTSLPLAALALWLFLRSDVFAQASRPSPQVVAAPLAGQHHKV